MPNIRFAAVIFLSVLICCCTQTYNSGQKTDPAVACSLFENISAVNVDYDDNETISSGCPGSHVNDDECTRACMSGSLHTPKGFNVLTGVIDAVSVPFIYMNDSYIPSSWSDLLLSYCDSSVSKLRCIYGSDKVLFYSSSSLCEDYTIYIIPTGHNASIASVIRSEYQNGISGDEFTADFRKGETEIAVVNRSIIVHYEETFC